LFVALKRFTVAFKTVVNRALADIRIDQGVVQCEGVITTGEGFVVTTKLFEGRRFFYVSPGVMAIEGERFFKADECVAGLLQVQEGFSCFHLRGEAQRDAIGRRWFCNGSCAPLDGTQGGADVAEQRQHAGAEEDFDDDGEADGLRGLLRRGLNSLQGGLLLGLNLADELHGEICQAGFVVMHGFGSSSDEICRSDCGGRKKRGNDAGQPARAALDPAVAKRGHEGLPKPAE